MNEWIWEIFQRLQTQARVAGFGTFTGFDLSAIRFLLEVYNVPKSRWLEAVELLDMITAIAIKHWNENNENN